MKKRNVKLLVSGLTLGLAALTTVGSTYAWFTTNGNATVSGMDITAEAAGEGIFVSKDGTKYDKSADLATYFTHTADNGTQDSALLQPVTSLNGSVFSKLSDSTFAKNDDEDVFDYTHIDNNTGYYVSFDLYFAITKGSKIQISAENMSAKQEGSDILKVARMSYAPYSRVNGDEDTNLNTKADYTDAKTNIMRLEAKTGQTADIAKTSIELLYNKSIANKSYGVYTDETKTNEERLDKIYDDANETKLLTSTPQDMVTDEQTYSKFIDGKIKELAIADGEYKFVKVHFNFWLEGNDMLCSNKVSADSFTGSLKFTAVPNGTKS